MMKFTSPSHKLTRYSSALWHDSKAIEGVRYATRRISLLQRIEMMKKIREIALKNEFLKAGDTAEQIEGALADALVRKLYLEWGLLEVQGLSIDGEAATPELLIAKGPEALSEEVVDSIRAELELSEDERKNS